MIQNSLHILSNKFSIFFFFGGKNLTHTLETKIHAKK
jgi:hypothetical protein